jgi:hypothetical protein
MKYSLLMVMFLVGCATEHRPPPRDITGVYIDCTNKASFENYFNKQLRLTESNKIELDPAERQYYAAIKDKIWTLRATCR